MSKVPVDRELLERMIQLDSLGLDAQQEYSALRAILAQPAEAEGVAVVAWANEALSAFISADCKAYGDSRGGAAGSAAGAHQTPLVRQDDHLAALSAVTAERDALQDQVKVLQSDSNSWQSGYDKGRHDGTKHRQSEVGQLRAEVEALRKDAERYRWLRDQAPKARGEWEIDGQRYGMMLGADQDDVDEAVDALMSAAAAKEA